MIGFGQVTTDGKHGCISGSCLNGYGTYISYSDGSKYVGEHRNNNRSGEGTITYNSGKEYVGKWKNGWKEGKGTYTYADGSKYVGEWEADYQHGQGTKIYADGKIEEGLWEEGVFIPKVNKKAPCPCRSGKKYKKCHSR